MIGEGGGGRRREGNDRRGGQWVGRGQGRKSLFTGQDYRLDILGMPSSSPVEPVNKGTLKSSQTQETKSDSS